MTKLLMTCGLLAALTACATSQPAPMAAAGSAAPTETATSAPAVQTAVAAAPAKGKLVCADSSRIDSHFKQRICMTPEQVEARRKAAQADMQNAQLQGSQCAQGGGGGACGGPPR